MNTCDFLFGVREAWRDNTALVDVESGRRYTYRQLQDAVRALSHQLQGLGFRPRDVIATHLYNGAEAVVAHLAIQYTGGVSCLLDPLIPAHSLAYYVVDSGARGLLTHLPRSAAAGHLPAGLPILEAAEVAELSDREPPAAAVPPYPCDPEAVAAIFYTSGTTSQPKGVMLPPRSFTSHFRIFTRACYTYAPEDRLLCFVPFSHGYGSKSIFLPCLNAGAAMVIMRSFQPFKVAEVVAAEGITHLFGVPSHYQQLLRRDELMQPMRQLKAAFCAAALLKLETAREWQAQAGYHLDEGYGLIETCTGVAFRRGRLPSRLGDIGTYPADLVDIAIVDDDFRFLPPGERGEIVVRGPSVMLGYLNKPEETARALHDGWFRTGDLGYKTAQDEIILAGRIKDVVNVAGIKVAPVEIEAALNEHPAVSESAVLGVPDDMYGEVVVAFVAPRPEAGAGERELMRFLQTRLMSFQVPKSIVFVEDFPRNTMGKIDKNALRDQVVA